jgi:hypothetical protein
MAWGKAGSTTTTSTGDTITVSGMTANKFNQFLFHTLASGNADTRYKYNGTDQMALRYNQNGGSDATSTSDTPPQQIWVAYGDHFNVNYMANVSGEEKLVITFDITASATGAGTAPQRMESVHKSVQSDQITEINISNGAAGDYLTDSNLSVLGSDITPAAAITFPTNVQVGSRAEITDSRKMYSYEIAPTYEDDFSSYADQTAADAAWVSNDTADFRVNITNDNFAFDSKVTSTTNTGAYYDLGSALSDTAWVVDFKLVITTNTLYSSGAVNAATYITMNDATNGGAIGGTVDAMGFYISGSSSGSKFNITWANSSYLNRGGGEFTGTITTGTFYMRLKRTGATSVKLEVYSDAGRSTLIEEKEVTGTDSGITGLRYFRIQDNQSSAGTGTGQQIGTIDDIKIYDGVTSPSSSTNYTWQEIGA